MPHTLQFVACMVMLTSMQLLLYYGGHQERSKMQFQKRLEINL